MKNHVLLLVIVLVGVTSKYPAMAPVSQYLIANRDDEISLARSAAPPSISASAEVLVLEPHGYKTAVKGTNGFVCFVERSWFAGFGDPEFWNSKLRSPNCFNAAAARTELPQMLKRTQWALSGMSKEEIVAKTGAAFAAHSFEVPEAGAMTYMLSKRGYTSDAAAGPWLPHLMFFLPNAVAKTWGAGLHGSPFVLGGPTGDVRGATLILVPVRNWSDGTPAPSHTHH
jgi:hypothetical protein